MTTKTAPEPREESAPADLWRPPRETAPSLERDEGPTLARALIILGMFFLAVGASPYVGPLLGRAHTFISFATGNFLLSLSLLCFLYHATRDRDLQIRRS